MGLTLGLPLFCLQSNIKIMTHSTITNHTSEFVKMSWAAYVVGGTIAGATAVTVGPALLAGALGFGAAGIVAGTPAAAMMSTLAPTIAGGVVATLQSVGTGAAISSTYVAVGAGVGAVVGAGASQ